MVELRPRATRDCAASSAGDSPALGSGAPLLDGDSETSGIYVSIGAAGLACTE